MPVNYENDDHIPWYVDVLNRWGIPTVFAGVLLYFFIVTMADGQKAIAKSQEVIIDSIMKNNLAMASLIDNLAHHQASTVANTRFLGAMCFNTATSEQARARCQDAAFK